MRWLLPILLLASCTDVGPDGYRFEQAEYFEPEVLTRLRLFDNVEDLRAALPAHAYQPNVDVMEFAAISPDRKKCTIYAMHPASRFQPEWLGHGTIHCHFGEGHPKQSKDRQCASSSAC